MAPTYGCGVTAARPLGLQKFDEFLDSGCTVAGDSIQLRSLRARPLPCFQDCNDPTINATLESADARDHTRHLYGRGFPKCAAAVRRAADVHSHGVASLGWLAIGVVGRNGVFPVDAARRLCLRSHAVSPAAALWAG